MHFAPSFRAKRSRASSRPTLHWPYLRRPRQARRNQMVTRLAALSRHFFFFLFSLDRSAPLTNSSSTGKKKFVRRGDVERVKQAERDQTEQERVRCCAAICCATSVSKPSHRSVLTTTKFTYLLNNRFLVVSSCKRSASLNWHRPVGLVRARPSSTRRPPRLSLFRCSAKRSCAVCAS